MHFWEQLVHVSKGHLVQVSLSIGAAALPRGDTDAVLEHVTFRTEAAVGIGKVTQEEGVRVGAGRLTGRVPLSVLHTVRTHKCCKYLSSH